MAGQRACWVDSSSVFNCTVIGRLLCVGVNCRGGGALNKRLFGCFTQSSDDGSEPTSVQDRRRPGDLEATEARRSQEEIKHSQQRQSYI